MKPSEALLGVILALALLSAPIPAAGQQTGKVYRIGCLLAGTPTSPTTVRNRDALEDGLRERGYIRGQNLVIEYRYTEGRDERAAPLAAELVNLGPDLIVAHGTAQVRAAKQATSTIPIVMTGSIDPVGRGLVASLARPGGNVTGPTPTAGVEIAGKYVQLLKEAIPQVSRVAVLTYTGGPSSPAYRKEIEAAAQEIGVTPQFHGVRVTTELQGAFAAMVKSRADALIVQSHPFVSTHARQIVDLAAKNRLPTVYPLRVHVEAGGLMAYGHNQLAHFRRVGFYADTILKGAQPGDLPVEQPTTFELVINLRTAKALGLTIPPTLLMRAEELIQ